MTGAAAGHRSVINDQQVSVTVKREFFELWILPFAPFLHYKDVGNGILLGISRFKSTRLIKGPGASASREDGPPGHAPWTPQNPPPLEAHRGVNNNGSCQNSPAFCFHPTAKRDRSCSRQEDYRNHRCPPACLKPPQNFVRQWNPSSEVRTSINPSPRVFSGLSGIEVNQELEMLTMALHKSVKTAGRGWGVLP